MTKKSRNHTRKHPKPHETARKSLPLKMGGNDSTKIRLSCLIDVDKSREELLVTYWVFYFTLSPVIFLCFLKLVFGIAATVSFSTEISKN